MPCRFETADLPTFVGEIAAVDDHRLPAGLAHFDCRNNRAADLGLVQDGFEGAVSAAVKRHGAERVGVASATRNSSRPPSLASASRARASTTRCASKSM